MLAVGGRVRRSRRLAEVSTNFFGTFDPRVDDIVKYTQTYNAGELTESSVVFTATITGIMNPGSNNTVYQIKYEDGNGFPATAHCGIGALSSMPVPARAFVEFGHDELSLIWEPDVHITNLHQDMIVHEEVGPAS